MNQNLIIRLLKILLVSTFAMLLGCTSVGLNIHPQPLTSPLLAKTGLRKVQEDWLTSLPTLDKKKPSSLKWLNANNVIYSISSTSKGQSELDIETLDVNTKTRKRIGYGSSPRPSPDGKWIVFVRTSGDKSELWIMQSDGAKSKRLFEFQKKVYEGYSMGFAWSPDSKYLAVNHQQYIPFENRDVKPTENSNQTSAVVAGHLRIAPPMSMIDIIDIKERKVRRVAQIDASVRDLSWLLDGQELLFMTERMGIHYSDKRDQAFIKLLTIENGLMRTLAAFDGVQQFLRPTASPDGEHVAFTYDADNPEFNYLSSIGIVRVNPLGNELSPIV